MSLAECTLCIYIIISIWLQLTHTTSALFTLFISTNAAQGHIFEIQYNYHKLYKKPKKKFVSIQLNVIVGGCMNEQQHYVILSLFFSLCLTLSIKIWVRVYAKKNFFICSTAVLNSIEKLFDFRSKKNVRTEQQRKNLNAKLRFIIFECVCVSVEHLCTQVLCVWYGRNRTTNYMPIEYSLYTQTSRI